MEQFGRYEIIERLGAGGMGVVYRGVAHGIGGFRKPVVIKRIHHHLAANNEVLQRFVNEAKIMMTLSHGNVVQVLDLGRLDEEHFMVLEYVEGRDLQTVLQRCHEVGEWPPEPLALFIAIQVLRGLDYVHRRTDAEGRRLGIVHRDMKPANVLCSFEGEVKLTDFGVATLAGVELTRKGDIIGTIGYMSPEQADSGTIDLRSDLFSVGTILYLLLCRAHPWPGNSPDDVMRSIRAARLSPPAARGVELDEKLETVLLTALARDVEDRYATAASMLTALEDHVRFLGTPATPSDLQGLLDGLFPDRERPPAAPGDQLVGTEIVASAPARSAVAARADIGLVEQDTKTWTVVPLGETATSDQERTKRRVRHVWLLFAGALLAVGSAVAVFTAVAPGPARTPAEPRMDQGTTVAVRRDASRPSADSSRPPTDSASPPRAKRPAPKRTRPRPPVVEPRPTAEKGWVRITTRPAYAVVYVGGRRVDTTPCRVQLPTGRQRIRLVSPKLRLEEIRTVTVRSDREVRLVLDDFGR